MQSGVAKDKWERVNIPGLPNYMYQVPISATDLRTSSCYRQILHSEMGSKPTDVPPLCAIFFAHRQSTRYAPLQHGRRGYPYVCEYSDVVQVIRLALHFPVMKSTEARNLFSNTWLRRDEDWKEYDFTPDVTNPQLKIMGWEVKASSVLASGETYGRCIRCG